MDSILEKWADTLMNYCFEEVDFAKAWRNGQKRFWVRYEPPADDLAKILVEKVFEKGGQVFLQQVPPWYDYSFYTKASDEVLSVKPEFELKELDHIAARLRILSSSNTRSLATVDPRKTGMRMKALKHLWDKATKDREEGKPEIKRCATLYPTHAYAQDSGMPYEEFKEFVYDAMLLNEKDPTEAWQAVEKKQEKLKRKVLDSADTIRIVDEEDETDIKMSVEGHNWIAEAGKGNFPSDEIFNAPRKDFVNGVITFPRIPQYHRSGAEVSGIRFVYKNGKLVEWKARVGQDFLDRLFEAHPDARYLGEVALGLHPKIQRVSKNILYDEKIGGTVHIALGRAYTNHVPSGKDKSQLNNSAEHWDLIRDMRVPTASVLINDEYELKWDAEAGRWVVQKL